MKFLHILLIPILSGCYSPTNVELRVDEIIDSLSHINNIVSYFRRDMDNYWLYTFSNEIGTIYDEEGNYLFSEIKQIKDKDILVYTMPKEIHDIDQEKFEKIESSYLNNIPHHTNVWYFAITKDGKKEVIIQPTNSHVMPYEIPQLRNFMNPLKETLDSEFIVNYISITTSNLPKEISITLNMNFYNHSNNTINNNFDYCAFILSKDTLFFEVDTLPLCDSIIDDTLWVDYPPLKKRFYLHLKTGKTEYFDTNNPNMIKDILNEALFVSKDGQRAVVYVPSVLEVYER